MDNREIRGYSILAKGDTPQAISKEEFLVPSQSSDKKYKVTHIEGWTCECKDFKYRKQTCKHIHSIRFWLKLRDGVSSNELMELENDIEGTNSCPNCNSLNIVKNGSRKTNAGIRQRYLCKDCKSRFVLDPIKYVKGNGKIVTLTMDLYFKGLSLRNITDTIYQFYGLKLHHETIRRWILKFSQKCKEYTDKLKPEVSKKWHADEMMMKVKKDKKWVWLWNVIDSETRFLLTQSVTKNRKVKDATELFNKAKERADGRPSWLVTDGLQTYRKAFTKAFYKRKGFRPEHIRGKKFKDKVNNNIVERMQGSIRDREKVMRALGSVDTASRMMDGWQVYYNFIRPHQALNGLTPSQVAEIDLNLGRNRWLSLVRKSVNNKV